MSICDLSFLLEEKLGLPNSPARKFNNGAEELLHEWQTFEDEMALYILPRVRVGDFG